MDEYIPRMRAALECLPPIFNAADMGAAMGIPSRSAANLLRLYGHQLGIVGHYIPGNCKRYTNPSVLSPCKRLAKKLGYTMPAQRIKGRVVVFPDADRLQGQSVAA